MKIYRTVFTRPNTSVAFPAMVDGPLAAHIQSTYSQCDPVRLVTMTSEISQDLLTLIITRTFATDADALAFSQDPLFVAWQDSLNESLAAAGIVRTSTLLANDA